MAASWNHQGVRELSGSLLNAMRLRCNVKFHNCALCGKTANKKAKRPGESGWCSDVRHGDMQGFDSCPWRFEYVISDRCRAGYPGKFPEQAVRLCNCTPEVAIAAGWHREVLWVHFESGCERAGNTKTN